MLETIIYSAIGVVYLMATIVIHFSETKHKKRYEIIKDFAFAASLVIVYAAFKIIGG